MDKEEMKEYHRKYYLKHKESLKKYQIQYREDNPDKVRDNNKKYRELNRDKCREQDKKYYLNNKESIKKRVSEYKKSNKGVINAMASHRRAVKINATIGNYREEIKMIYVVAKEIEAENEIDMHVDHIHPLSRGGLHVPWNLQIITAEKNLKKSNSFDVTRMVLAE